jgi:MFS family permease
MGAAACTYFEGLRADDDPSPESLPSHLDGYDTGFFGGTLALDSFVRDFKLDERGSNTSANLVSLFQGGSFFGAGLQLPLTEKFGRKYTILFANVIFMASAFAQTFAHGSVEVFMVGRFLVRLLLSFRFYQPGSRLTYIRPDDREDSLLGSYRLSFRSTLPSSRLHPFEVD